MSRQEDRSGLGDKSVVSSATDVRVGDPRTEWDAELATWRTTIEERVNELTGDFEHTYTGPQLRSWDVVEIFQQGDRQREVTYESTVNESGRYPQAYWTEESYHRMGYRYERTRLMNLDNSPGELRELVVGDQSDWWRSSSGNRVGISFGEGEIPTSIQYRSKGEKDLIQLTRSEAGWTVTSDHAQNDVGWHMRRIGQIVNERRTPEGATRHSYRKNSTTPLDARKLRC